jgi:2-aminoadipate transaminase
MTLPNGQSSLKLFEQAVAQKVAFVPGVPFYTDGRTDANTMRLNFTCADEATIFEGMQRLGKLVKQAF